MLAKCGKHDSYYSSFFYCVGISEDTRNHVDRMFDFKERLIKPEALHEGWQTDGTTYWSWYGFGIQGSAVASLIVQLLTVLVLMFYFISRKTGIGFRKFSFDRGCSKFEETS